MIHTLLQSIANDLGAFLKNQMGEREEVVVLSELMNNVDGSFAVGGENKVICTLLHIEQERINLNAPMAGHAVTNPPFNLNLYVLFSAFYTPLKYVGALQALSLTLGFFQGKQVFTPANTPSLPTGLNKVTVEMVNTDMKDLSNFWTALGAKHMPSVLFKIKMVSITAEQVMEETRAITGIDTRLE